MTVKSVRFPASSLESLMQSVLRKVVLDNRSIGPVFYSLDVTAPC